MKAKLKNANAITRFLLAHGEKLGMAAVLAVAFLLIWKSLGRERLDANNQPSQLATSADAATNHYMGMSWNNFPKEERVDAQEFAARASDGVMTPVRAADFPLIAPINPRVTEPIGLRVDPTLLAPEKLEVNSGSGLWAVSDPEVIKRMAIELLKKQQRQAKDAEEAAREAEREMEQGGRGRRGRGESFGRGEAGMRGFAGGAMGGLEMTDDDVPVVRPTNAAGTQGFEEIRNTSWVTVLAKVPIKQQVEKYEDALAAARGYDPATDMPVYIGYQIQRAEVTEDGLSDWVTVSVLKKTIIEALERRPIEYPEVANEKYVNPLLTWPLPAMVLRPWGKEVTHSDLPIPTPEDLLEEMQGEQPQQPAVAPGEEGGDEFDRQERARAAMPGGAWSMEGRGMMPGGFPGEIGGRGRMMMPGGMGGEMGFAGRGMGMGMGMGMGGMMMGQGAGAYNDLPDKPWDGKTKYYLFRYFDSSVKPGHRYKYRVRLALSDVNKNPIPEKYLDPAVVTRKKETNNRSYRWTDWSEVSPTAAVPSSGLVHVVQASAAKGFNEPEVKLIVKSLDAPHTAEVAVAEEFTRGSVINLSKQKPTVIWSPSFQVQTEDGDPVKSPEFDIVTGLTLLDFNGGEELNRSRDLLAPSRALVMDATGRMSIERELDDLRKIREYDMIETASKEALRQKNDMGRGGGREGGGRGRARGGF